MVRHVAVARPPRRPPARRPDARRAPGPARAATTSTASWAARTPTRAPRTASPGSTCPPSSTPTGRRARARGGRRGCRPRSASPRRGARPRPAPTAPSSAREARDKGNDVVFGPVVNLLRTPLNGRTFEGYGEDPLLTARMAVGWIRGAQAQGVIGDVKHFAANNQEGFSPLANTSRPGQLARAAGHRGLALQGRRPRRRAHPARARAARLRGGGARRRRRHGDVLLQQARRDVRVREPGAAHRRPGRLGLQGVRAGRLRRGPQRRPVDPRRAGLRAVARARRSPRPMCRRPSTRAS